MKYIARVLLAALLLCGAACGTEKEIETRVEKEVEVQVEVVTLECSPTVPNGACEAGYTCFEGECVTSGTLCSQGNPEGRCGDGLVCYGGGCVVASVLCSPAAPWGACDNGHTCLEGACVLTGTLCSPNNPTGACAAGNVCFSGGCVPSTALCSLANPTGPCQTGSTCLEGSCVATASLCSTGNPTGVCGGGLTCIDGVCGVPGVDPCDVMVNTEQPVIVARGAIGASATGQATLNAVVAGNSFTVGATGSAYPAAAGVSFTGVAADPNAEQFLVGATDADTAANLALAINANPIASALVTALATDATISFTAVPAGAAGNGIGLGGTNGRFQFPASVLSGGVGTGKAELTVGGLRFKDASGDGALDRYEDWRYSPICRAKDLVARMTVPQKIGLMSEGGTLGNGTSDGLVTNTAYARMAQMDVRQALIRFGSRSGRELAAYANALQEVAEALPHGIPVVLTGDPTHGLRMSTHASSGAQTLNGGVFSLWPVPLGLGAANDDELTWLHFDTVRREFMAAGLRWQLGPMIDVVTEPRWERIQSTFGENGVLAAKHARAAVIGFQGSDDGDLRNGIAATVKHFPGAGTNEDGMDSHRYPGRYAAHPGGMWEYQLLPFQAAFDAGAASIMACYSIFKDTPWDENHVPSGFEYAIITELGKKRMGFSGMVTGDWGTAGGSAYGSLQNMTTAERAARWLKAGSHQFGNDPSSYFAAAYEQGLVGDAEIDEAAAKILEMTFKLGVFENPYVDPDVAEEVVRGEVASIDGFNAQKRAIVLLRNQGSILPISGARSQPDRDGDGTIEIYYDGVVDALHGADALSNFIDDYDFRSPADPTATPALRAIVHTPDITQADVAILRIAARKGTYFGLDAGVPLSFDKPFPGTQNDSNYGAALKDRNRVIDAFRVRDGYTDANGNPVAATNPNLKIVLVMMMDRPGIVRPFIHGLVTLDELPGQAGSYPLVSDDANVNPGIVTTSNANGKAGVEGFLVDFGAYDRALLDFLFNKNVPPGVTSHGTARLPAELPSSDAEVEEQYEDVPADTRTPTYNLGAGMNL